jgi:putative transposase
MNFDKDRLYHVYNQGNNRKKIFYSRKDYLLFYKKIEVFICPYADILAWCLMPNHFHLMLLVKETELRCEPENALGSASSETLKKSVFKKRTLNDSLGIMLRSYTRIINAQEGLTGSLFRKETKANCINSFKDLQPNFWKSKIAIFNMLPENQYPQICFNYIHHNPVKSSLVEKDTDWEFSSARDYANLRRKSIVKRKIAGNYVDF